MARGDAQRTALLAEREWLAEFVRAAEGHPVLSSFEAGFVHDIRVSYVTGVGAVTWARQGEVSGVNPHRVSRKQAEIIRRIWERVKIEPMDARDDALSDDGPRYWMDEPDEVLRCTVEAYVLGADMDGGEIAALRAYFRQYVGAMRIDQHSPEIVELRGSIDRMSARTDVEDWLARALAAGQASLMPDPATWFEELTSIASFTDRTTLRLLARILSSSEAPVDLLLDCNDAFREAAAEALTLGRVRLAAEMLSLGVLVEREADGRRRSQRGSFW